MSASIPSTQSQWRLSAGGAGVAGLQLFTDAAVPAVGRGQVLIRVRAVSLNYRDLLIKNGTYLGPTPDNVIPVSDGAGEIVAIGEEVTQWQLGDRVMAPFTPKWIAGNGRNGEALSGGLGNDYPGMLTQYRAFDANLLVRVPAHFTYEEAATLPCAGVTAWNALTTGIHPIRADHSVLVMGTGGVSVLAAQIAKASGARVIATSSSDEKLNRLVELGLVNAADTINYKKVAEWGKKAKELTGGIGVDHVIEIGGNGTIHQAIEAVRPEGEVSIIGLVSGVDPNKAIDPLRILGGGFTVRGIFVGSVEHLKELSQLYTQHQQYRPIIGKVFPLTQAKEAYEYLESAQHFGKVVIRVD